MVSDNFVYTDTEALAGTSDFDTFAGVPYTYMVQGAGGDVAAITYAYGSYK